MSRCLSRRDAIASIMVTVLAPCGAARAQSFPGKPITLIVPFPAGGATDRHLRVLAEVTGRHLGQAIVVENRAGAGGTLGPSAMALGSRADGYTISQYPQAMLRYPHMQKTNWHPIDDFTFIIGLSGYTFGFVVRGDSPYMTPQEYIDAARREPDRLDFGSAGIGTTPHLLMAEVAVAANVKLNHVPFKGNADLIQALLGGHVASAVSDSSGWVGHVGTGRMRLLMTFGERRTRRWPDAPTARELGYNVVSSSPYGLVGPRGMDPAVVKKLHDAFKKAMDDPQHLELLAELDQEIWYRSGEDYRNWAIDTFAKNKALMERLGLAGK